MATSSPRSYESEIRRLTERIDRLERAATPTPRMRELADAALNHVQDGQVPVYRRSTGLWHPEDQSGGGGGGGALWSFTATSEWAHLGSNYHGASWPVAVPTEMILHISFSWDLFHYGGSYNLPAWGDFGDYQTLNMGLFSSYVGDLGVAVGNSTTILTDPLPPDTYTAAVQLGPVNLSSGEWGRAQVVILGLEA